MSNSLAFSGSAGNHSSRPVHTSKQVFFENGSFSVLWTQFRVSFIVLWNFAPCNIFTYFQRRYVYKLSNFAFFQKLPQLWCLLKISAHVGIVLMKGIRALLLCLHLTVRLYTLSMSTYERPSEKCLQNLAEESCDFIQYTCGYQLFSNFSVQYKTFQHSKIGQLAIWGFLGSVNPRGAAINSKLVIMLQICLSGASSPTCPLRLFFSYS